MPTAPLLLTPDARRTANRLLDVLQRERIADGAAATDSSVLGPCGIDAKSSLIEQAKGALMLHYGIDSHQAFAVLVGLARTSHTPVPTIAHTLLRGICEGNPQTEARDRALMRWLGAQLRDCDLGPHNSGRHLLIAIRHMRLRARVECGSGVCRGARLTQTRVPAPRHPHRSAEPRCIDDLSR